MCRERSEAEKKAGEASHRMRIPRDCITRSNKGKTEKQLQKLRAGVEIRAGGGTSVPEKPGRIAGSSMKVDQAKTPRGKNTITTSKNP